MLKICRYSFLTIFLFISSFAAAAQTEWFNSLKPQGQGIEKLIITKQVPHIDQVGRDEKWDPGKFKWIVSNYDIIIPEKSTTQEQKAAYELSRWLEEITGVVFVVKTDVSPKIKHEISVGKTNRLESAKLGIDDSELKYEGYAIQVKDGDLYLLGGNKRGPIYAVFALLEEDLGCRWYPNNVTRIPKTPELKFNPVSRVFVPKLEGREPFYWSAVSPEWSLRNRTNSYQVPLPKEWGGNILWAWRSHSFKQCVPPEQYFQNHAEYYGLRGTKRVDDRLCLTNPDILPIAIENVRKVLKENPDARVINIAKEDGGSGECDCNNCTSFNKAHGSASAAHVEFVNKIAEKLEKEFPNVIFCTYAYTYTLKPPTGIKARPNVGIRLCNSDSSQPFRSVIDSSDYQQIHAGWQAVTDKIFIYDYWNNWSHMLLPYPDIHMIAKNIRYFVDHNALEISGLGTATRCKAGDRDAMFAWVTAKLLWNPALDVNDLILDFDLGYYGQAGPHMAAYNKLLLDSYEKCKNDEAMIKPKNKRRFGAELPLYSKDFIEKASLLFERAEKAAENKDVLNRVELAELSILYLQLEKGPEFAGANYKSILDKFTSICTQQEVHSLNQGEIQPALTQKINDWQERLNSFEQTP